MPKKAKATPVDLDSTDEEMPELVPVRGKQGRCHQTAAGQVAEKVDAIESAIGAKNEGKGHRQRWRATQKETNHKKRKGEGKEGGQE